MFIILIGAFLGLLPATIAAAKGRNFFLWWLYGGLLFIFALPHLLFASKNVRVIEQRRSDTEPVIKCPSCAEVIKADAKICRYCQRDVSIMPAVASYRALSSEEPS